jgi:3-oxoacyl-[acyl-carrier protein] reductase
MHAKNYLITGAGKGIGKALCLELLRKGHNVWALSRNPESLNLLKTEGANIIEYDLSRLAENENTILPSGFPDKLDGLVNNAGSLINSPVDTLKIGDAREMWEINVLAPFVLVKKLIPLFSAGSHIVNIGSMGGFQGSSKFSGLSMYSATKAALAALSECWAGELASLGISVNCLALGAVNTEMLQKAFPGYEAPVQVDTMAEYIADFLEKGHKLYNGKVLPVSLTNPE